METIKKVLKFLLVGVTLLTPILVQSQVKSDIADQSFAAFDAAFLLKNNGLTYYRSKLYTTSKDYFWQQALDIQTPQDVYFRTNNPAVKTEVTDLLNAFLVQNTGNGTPQGWEWNEYNDDLFWAVLAFARGYEITGNQTFLDQTKYGYNLAFYHTTNGGWGWDNTFGGGIWWSKAKADKNALSNSPGVIAACYLYKFTNTVGYLNMAKAIYAWERSHIWDSTTGDVWGAILADGTTNKATAIFNNGAFGGAANFLYQITGDKAYYDDAKLAFDRVIAERTWSGILASPVRNGTELAEYIRYLGDFARQNYLWNEYYSFMKRCADAAWSIRRKDINIAWNDFTKQMPIDTAGVNECNSAVVMQQVTPALQALPGTIEAENYSYMKGIDIQSNAAASGAKNVSGVATGDNLEYIVTIPSSGVYKISFNIAGAVDGSVNFQQNGQTLGTITFPATGNLQTYSTVTTSLYLTAGIQSIKLVGVTGNWNIDSWSAALVTAALPGKIQAESYSKMSGVTQETTTDVDGGINVNGIDASDYIEFSVNVPTTGAYNISYRVSAQSAGASVRLYQDKVALITTNIPRTGNYRNLTTYQNWTTVTTTANLSAGTRTLSLYALTGGWNINWVNIVPVNPAPTAVNDISSSAQVSIYPNPVINQLNLDCGDQNIVNVKVYDNSGRILIQSSEKKVGKTTIDVSGLLKGIYVLEITTDKNERVVRKFIK
jgi:predicted alpha-1,6-mannanase (GH76 family)